jgi:hypothetical protein
VADGIQRYRAEAPFDPVEGRQVGGIWPDDEGPLVRFSDVQARLYAAEKACRSGVRLWEYLNALGPEPGSDLRQALDRFQEALRVFVEEPDAAYRSTGESE